MKRTAILRYWLVSAVIGVSILLTVGCDKEVEKALGSMSASSVEKQYRVVKDPLLNQWIDVHGHMLVAGTVRQSIPYKFKVIETDMVNAFAAPYGHIYVTTGLLEFAETEDEVIGVIAHEIGHVTHRHSLSQVKRSFLYSIGLQILAGSDEDAADIAGIGLGLFSLRYSRKNEYQADDMGRRLSLANGFDPHGVVTFFDKLLQKHENERPSTIEVMFRTHPPTHRRIARQQAMPELSDQNPTSLLLIGRSYARRHQYRRATEFLAKAAELSPKDDTTLITLADAQLGAGHRPKALHTYRMAGRVSDRPTIAKSIKLASKPTGGGLAMVSEQQRQHAAAALSDAQNVAGQARAVVEFTQRHLNSTRTTFNSIQDDTSSMMQNLIELSGNQTELEPQAEDAVTSANSAVNEAAEAVYALEAQRKDLMTRSQQLQTLAETLASQLGTATEGNVRSGDVSVLRRSLVEVRHAISDVRSAMRTLDDARSIVVRASRRAQETTHKISSVLGGQDSNFMVETTREAADTTRSLAKKAKQATREGGKLKDRASLRTRVARINSAAIGTNQHTRKQLDGLVAHYMLSDERTVRNLRNQGMGYGDIAALLGAARSVDAKPDELAGAVTITTSAVDHVTSIGADTDGALVLMKYLTGAIEYEIQAGTGDTTIRQTKTDA